MASITNAASSELPSKQDFIKNQLNVVDECSICLSPFDTVHKPIQIRTSKCQHIFGTTCLLKWLESSKSCPLCRTQLFFHAPNFIPGQRGSSFYPINTIMRRFNSPEEAEVFLMMLWGQLWTLYNNTEIFDSDINDVLQLVIKQSTKNFAHGFPIYDAHKEWPAILMIAQEMIEEHFINGEFRCCMMDLEEVWMPSMGSALGWEFEGMGEDEEEEEGYEGDHPGADDGAADNGGFEVYSEGQYSEEEIFD